MTIRRLLLAGLAAGVAACAGTNIGSPNDYEKVPLNRVFPYPTPEELAQQKTEVTLATHFGAELPASDVGPSMTVVQQRLLRVLQEAGARVIDRSLDPLKDVRRDLTQKHKKSRANHLDVDWVLISRITQYDVTATYEPPSGLFKSQEELASDPGTCTHKGVVQVDIKAFVLPGDDVRATFSLKNEGEFEQSSYDESCPVDAAREQVLMDGVLEEALGCIGTTVKNQFSPRGYLEEHRVSPAGNRHIYRTSLGKSNGARPGLELSIFRVQYMTTADGAQDREERRIGTAVVTDQIGEDHSWVAVDPGDVEQTLLAGDLVRAVYSDSFTEGLGFDGCNRILKVDRGPR